MPPMSWAFERERVRLPHDPAEAKRLLDAAGFRDPDGDGPRPRLSAHAEDVDVGGVSRPGGRHPAGSRARRRSRCSRSARRSSRRCRPTSSAATSRCTPRSLSASPIPTCCGACSTPAQVPPSGLNRAHYRNADVDRLIDAGVGDRRTTSSAGGSTGRRSRSIARDVPVVSSGTRRTSPSSSPDIHGVRLSPDRRFHVPERCLPFESLGSLLVLLCWCAGTVAGVGRQPLRSAACASDRAARAHFDVHAHQGEEALARRLARPSSSACASEFEPTLGRPRGPRAGDPRRSDGFVERLGDSGALQRDRDNGGAAVCPRA